MNRTTILAAIAPVFLLGGCVSLGGGKVPASLLTLTANDTAAVGTSATGSAQTALALIEFEVPRSIDVTRVPVQVSDTEIAYLKDAEWVERPARLFRRVVAETIRARSGRMVIDGDDPGAVANDRVSGTLRSFGYDARTSSVVVVFDATRSTGGAQVLTKRFEARVGGIPAKASLVAPALNQAANDVAGQIADWVGGAS